MPVNRTTSISTTFGASHEIKDHPLCSRNHGHSYRVTWSFAGSAVLPSSGLTATYEQLEKTMAVVRELAGRKLNDMMPASHPDPGGMASYLLDRLTMHGVTKVEVHESETEITGVAERLPG